jgi:hypothetical protein
MLRDGSRSPRIPASFPLQLDPWRISQDHVEAAALVIKDLGELQFPVEKAVFIGLDLLGSGAEHEQKLDVFEPLVAGREVFDALDGPGPEPAQWSITALSLAPGLLFLNSSRAAGSHSRPFSSGP